MHLKLTNGVPAKYTLGQLRRDNPQTSFPKQFPDEMLASYDVYPYAQPSALEYDNLTARLVEGSFEQDEQGNWSLPYVVEQKTLEDAERNVRSNRDSLLRGSDWELVKASEERIKGNPNASPATAVLDYRQALRDITNQTGFPYEVIWPTKPE